MNNDKENHCATDFNNNMVQCSISCFWMSL